MHAPSKTAATLIPSHPTLGALREAAAGCRACPLWQRGTRTVFGEGPTDARVVLVGEQPGDLEDRAGRPFVGPAGRILDRALEEAGVDRRAAYVTNAVKHFKWKASGKRRLHEKPNAMEIGACRPWVEAELEVIEPDVLVAMGATAAQALLGRQVRVTRDRGRLLPSELARHAIVTVHPSSILRAPSDEERHRALQGLIDDLRLVAELLRHPPAENAR